MLQAKVHEDGRQMGCKPMHASHLTRYPTDSIIDDTIRAQLEAEEEAQLKAARAAGHLPSRAFPLLDYCLHGLGTCPRVL